jgi:hypothetical protein
MEDQIIWYGDAKKVRDVMEEPNMQMATDKMMLRHVFHKSFS